MKENLTLIYLKTCMERLEKQEQLTILHQLQWKLLKYLNRRKRRKKSKKNLRRNQKQLLLQLVVQK